MKRLICAMLGIALLLVCAACGAPAAENTPPATQTPSAEVSPSPSPSVEPTPSPEPSAELAPSPSPSTEPSPEPEPTVSVDPASKLLPNLANFLYRKDESPIEHYAYGLPYGCQVSFEYIPLPAFEAVREEVLALMSEPVYQLELTDHRENAYYDRTAFDYYYNYTGSSGEITQITDKYEEKYSFHVMLRFLPTPDYDSFQLYCFYCEAFELTDPGVRTTRNTETNSDGGVLTAPPEEYAKGDNDFWEKCSSCHGSGRCTRCNGTGEVDKFQAGLGRVELDCTSCNGGKCRWCGGDGKR